MQPVYPNMQCAERIGLVKSNTVHIQYGDPDGRKRLFGSSAFGCGITFGCSMDDQAAKVQGVYLDSFRPLIEIPIQHIPGNVFAVELPAFVRTYMELFTHAVPPQA